MKNRNLFIIILMVLVFLVAVSCQSFAFWGEKSKGKDFPKPNRDKIEKVIIRKLDLTDKQKEAYKVMQDKLQQEAKVIRGKIKDISEKLRLEMQKEAPDKNSVHKVISEINKLRTDIQIKRTDLLLDLRKLLTKEQREKFQKMLDKKDGKGRPGRGLRHKGK